MSKIKTTDNIFKGMFEFIENLRCGKNKEKNILA